MTKDKLIYVHSSENHNTRAAERVVPYIMGLFPVTSVLDVGCGWGTWMTVFLDNGVTDVWGIDGDYVDKSRLKVSEDRFHIHDLREPFNLRRKFDLVISLEVAEHLPKECAETFVSSLCDHADRIIFSAAIPGQGGQNHVNEQWANYWSEIFNQRGYRRFDVIRPSIWNLDDVDVWYRQNIFLYAREDRTTAAFENIMQVAEVHPALWQMKIDALRILQEEVNGFEKGNAGIKRSFKALVNAIKNKM